MAPDNGRVTTAQALGQLTAEVQGLRRDVDDMRVSLGKLSAHHDETRDMVRAHRTGIKVLWILGGAVLALVGAIKGINWR